MSVDFAPLDDDQVDEILRLQGYYYREAKKCRAAKAYLSGCAMLGASLEAALIGMVNCFADEVTDRGALPRSKGRTKPLLNWNLSELLRVAKKMNWLPAGLALEEEWNRRRARIGDYAEVVRILRNLVHPARYLSEHARRRITSRHLSLAFEVLEIAVRNLESNLHAAMRAELKQESRI